MKDGATKIISPETYFSELDDAISKVKETKLDKSDKKEIEVMIEQLQQIRKQVLEK